MTTGCKVLVSAYSCEPGRGSEPGVGWDWVRQIARYHDVWVITRANNRASIEIALQREAIGNVRWFYYDLPQWARFWKRGPRGVALYYYLWQAAIYPLARRLHREVAFDFVHHVTFGKYWAPSFLALLDARFIWGPLGGGESAPASFRANFGWRGRLYEAARTFGRGVEHLDPFVRMTARRSVLALAKTPETAEKLTQLGCRAVKVYQEVSLPTDEIRSLGAIARHDPPPIRILSTGRLLHWKGFHLGIEAFARFQREFANAQYTVVGNGPERGNLEGLATRLGLRDRVIFRGNVSRRDALAELGRSDIVLHPSLHDSSGWVCIEAMAAGRPVICLDCGGPAMQVTPDAGYRVPPDTPEGAIGGITAALLTLSRDADLRRRMGEAGNRRVAADFNSARQAEALAAIYQGILDSADSGALDFAEPPAAAARSEVH
jgi:glycosyltransferase involved in cell wall biosynthesis